MKIMILAAAAALAISGGAACANSEGPSDGGLDRGALADQPQLRAERNGPEARIFAVQSRTHDAREFTGLNGGGG